MHRSQVLLSCSHVECTVEVTRQRFKDGETQHARAGGNERDGSFAFCHFHLGLGREIVRSSLCYSHSHSHWFDPSYYCTLHHHHTITVCSIIRPPPPDDKRTTATTRRSGLTPTGRNPSQSTQRL
jgi:hypothetical protein